MLYSVLVYYYTANIEKIFNCANKNRKILMHARDHWQEAIGKRLGTLFLVTRCPAPKKVPNLWRTRQVRHLILVFTLL